eukprot:TRINITY_DN80214_c0_g1_i1.p1 TRINITY_DN80214_c0_g1~~TRINITY_DN80214_c0_g1_i1.p1  ORF type:complete len:373 (-),score=67.80 TRINITY_DN80214_c0_g1_i1:133-1251(-)
MAVPGGAPAMMAAGLPGIPGLPGLPGLPTMPTMGIPGLGGLPGMMPNPRPPLIPSMPAAMPILPAASLTPQAGVAAGGALPSHLPGGMTRDAAIATFQSLLRMDPQLPAKVNANPFLVVQLLKQAVGEDDNTNVLGAAASEPTQVRGEIQELADHFGLDPRITRQLDDEMKKRKASFHEDIGALYDILETARNPAGLLSAKIGEMQKGTFVGRLKMDKDLKEFVKRYNLDEQAKRKIAEIIANREETRREEDILFLHRHLETSNKPSARVMMIFSKLKFAVDEKNIQKLIGEPDKRVAPGSYRDKVEREKKKEERKDRDKDRRRSRSWEKSRRSRSRSRDRRKASKSRSRSKSRKRSRSRSKSRKRSRSRRR